MNPLPLSMTAHLATLMRVDDTVDLWSAEDAAAILAHQLAAPVAADLARFHTPDLAVLERDMAAATPPIATFADLLHHPRPPVNVLYAVKDFAKSAIHSSDAPVPAPVATVIYLAAIVAALLRTGTSITTLSPPTLHAAVQWALDQPWLTASLRTEFAAAIPALTRNPA